MAEILVDSNVLLDLITHDPVWYPWSSKTLEREGQGHALFINIAVYAEISTSFARIEEVDAALADAGIGMRVISTEAAFLAGKCFVRYRRAGGTKASPLPDFFIGAQAATDKTKLITRDAARYRSYFPTVVLIAPP